jgi:hypothetical protein
LDLRLVLGVLLVLVCVLVGARAMAAADSSVRVWAIKSDLAAGTVLGRDDLRPVRVRLFDNAARYLATSRSPAGQTLTRDLGADELLPRDAVTAKPCGSLVSVPVAAQHVPGTIVKGQRIDVFATPKGAQGGKTEQVLRAVPVQSAQRPKGGLVSATSEWSIIVRVPSGEASAVVRAVRTADIDVAVVTEPVSGRDDACGGPGGPAPGGTPAGGSAPSGSAPGATPNASTSAGPGKPRGGGGNDQLPAESAGSR